MNNSTLMLEDGIKSVSSQLQFIKDEVVDLSKYYFSTGSDTLVSALSTNGTPATVSSALTKLEVTNGITLVQQLEKFFTNLAVTQADYQASVDNLVNGSNTATAVLSNDVESVGSRLKILGINLKGMRKQAETLIKIYNASELSAIIGTLGSTTVIFGCNTVSSKMTSGIVLLQQFVKFLNNEAVTQGDYLDTVTKWNQS